MLRMSLLGTTLAATPSCSDLKRHHGSSSEADTDSCPPKRWHYVLASESDMESDGTESIYSIQEKSTDLAKDTSDTCTKSSESSDDRERMVEFEVLSLSEEEQFHPLQSKDSSSSPEDLRPWLPVGERLESSLSIDSTSTDCDGDIYNSCNKGSYKFCLRCKDTNLNPLFRYCSRCHKLRKNFLPPRPKGGRKKRLPTYNLDSKNSIESGIGLSSSQTLTDSNERIANNGVDYIDLCNICMIRPRDGGYSHGHIVHNYSCYKCSVKVYNQSGRCPVCNTKVKQICKIIR